MKTSRLPSIAPSSSTSSSASAFVSSSSVPPSVSHTALDSITPIEFPSDSNEWRTVPLSLTRLLKGVCQRENEISRVLSTLVDFSTFLQREQKKYLTPDSLGPILKSSTALERDFHALRSMHSQNLQELSGKWNFHDRILAKHEESIKALEEICEIQAKRSAKDKSTESEEKKIIKLEERIRNIEIQLKMTGKVEASGQQSPRATAGIQQQQNAAEKEKNEEKEELAKSKSLKSKLNKSKIVQVGSFESGSVPALLDIAKQSEQPPTSAAAASRPESSIPPSSLSLTTLFSDLTSEFTTLFRSQTAQFSTEFHQFRLHSQDQQEKQTTKLQDLETKWTAFEARQHSELDSLQRRIDGNEEFLIGKSSGLRDQLKEMEGQMALLEANLDRKIKQYRNEEKAGWEELRNLWKTEIKRAKENGKERDRERDRDREAVLGASERQLVSLDQYQMLERRLDSLHGEYRQQAQRMEDSVRGIQQEFRHSQAQIKSLLGELFAMMDARSIPGKLNADKSLQLEAKSMTINGRGM